MEPTEIVKGDSGRPTKLTDETITKLESILKIGGTVEEACSYALIAPNTYYRWLKENEDLVMKMDAAKYYADIVAKNVVVDAIVKDRDLSTAKWWLEKRQFKEDRSTVVPVQINNLIQNKKEEYGF